MDLHFSWHKQFDSERTIAGRETKKIFHMKVLVTSFLEPEYKGQGNIMGVPHPFLPNSILSW